MQTRWDIPVKIAHRGELIGIAPIIGNLRGQAVMKGGSQAIEIRAWVCLIYRRDFGVRKTTGSHCNGITRLGRVEVASYAKVNQEDAPTGSDDHVRRFEVAENDLRMLLMQVIQNITELKRVVHHIAHI